MVGGVTIHDPKRVGIYPNCCHPNPDQPLKKVLSKLDNVNSAKQLGSIPLILNFIPPQSHQEV